MMIRIFVLIAFLLGILFNMSAQRDLKGTIKDAKTGEAIGRAIIEIVPTGTQEAISTSFSDFGGRYSIATPATGMYTLKVKMMGYKPYEKQMNAAMGVNQHDVKLESNKSQIKEVEIEGTRARVTLREDTIVYDAKAFKTHKDANVEDLVKKMPGITTEGGKLKAHGEEVKRVTVDGQEFFGDDVNVALRNLPAETIDKVEVFDAQSDRASFTGFNDGNTTKSINLKTKAGMRHGYFGKAYAGAGTEVTYQGGGNFNYFDGDIRVSVLGLANNINNLNFSTSEIIGAVSGSSSTEGVQGRNMMRNMGFGMRVAGGGPGGGGALSNFTVSNIDGVNTAMSFGTNYNDRWGKNKNVKVTSSIFTNKTDNVYQQLMDGQNFVNPSQTLNTKSQTDRTGLQANTKFNSRLEGFLDPKNSYIWTNNLNINESNTNSTLQTRNYFLENINSFENNQNSNTKNNGYSLSSNFLYRMKLNKVGRTFSFNPIFDISNQEGISEIQNRITTSGISNQNQQNIISNQWSTTISAVLSYTEPSGKYGQWLATYSPSIAFKRNQYFNYLSPTIGQSGTLDTSLSNILENPIFYNTGGLSYRLQFTKWRFMFGANAQNIIFDTRNQLYQLPALSRNFFNILPHFNITYKSQLFRVRLNYSTNVNVPSASNIQPVADISSPQSIFQGNQNLKSEFAHNLFFHFIKPNITKGTFLFFMTNMILTFDKNSSSSFTAVSDTMINQIAIRKGAVYNSVVNLNGHYNGIVFGNYVMPIKALKANLSLNASLTYNRTPNLINGLENLTENWIMSNGVMLSSNISEDIDFSIGYNPRYVKTSYTLFSNANNNFLAHNLTSNLKITFLKDFVFNSDFSYNYNNQIDPSLNQHIFLLGSSLAYKFMKNRDWELKLSAFDIFNQNRNISRSVQENTILDSRINALNRYFMLTLTHTFKKFKSGANLEDPNPMMRMMIGGGNH